MTKLYIQPAFAAGEVSPSVYSRTDLQKYHSAVALARNVFVDYRGGLSNRPGTKFVQAVQSAGKTRLVRFQFSTIQAYLLEFGDHYIRFYISGAPVLETNKTISGVTQANPGVMNVVAHGWLTGDWVFVQNVGGMTQLNNRTFRVTVIDADHVSLQSVLNVNIDTSGYGAFTAGGTAARVYTIGTSYASADIFALKFTQSADVMTITHPSYQPQDLTRTANTAWTLTPHSFAIAGPVGALAGATDGAAGTLYWQYTVTAVIAGKETDIARPISVNGTTTGRINALLTWNPVTGAQYYNVYRSLPVTVNAQSTTPRLGYVGSTYGNRFTDSDILNQIPDFSNSPPSPRVPFAPGGITNIAVTAGGTGHSINTSVTVTDATGTGAIIWPIVDSASGAITGFWIRDPGLNYTAPTLTFNEGSGVTYVVTVGTTVNVYPSVVNYYQQRIVFAAPGSTPNGLWFSRTGNYNSFAVHNPVQDDDAITISLASQQVNAIRHLVPVPNGFLAFTSDSAWNLNVGSQVLTPTNVNAMPQTYAGASTVSPVVVNSDVLYVQERGSVLRDMTYNFFNGAFTTTDLSVLSHHLMFRYSINDMAWAEVPYKLLWMVRSDGKLLTLTYLKDQELYGWAQHDTENAAGIFESVCTIPEGDEDAVYFVVIRTLYNGSIVRTVERLASRKFSLNAFDAGWFLDCARQYNGAPVTTVSGLEHFNGRTVSALADGVVYTGLSVTNNQLTIPGPAAGNIIVGLPMTAQIQMLPLDDPQDRPTMQGRRKKNSILNIRCTDTRFIKAGPSFSRLYASKVTTAIINTLQGTFSVNGLFTGDDRLVMASQWSVLSQPCIQMDSPYPATILGVMPEFTDGDVEAKKNA